MVDVNERGYKFAVELVAGSPRCLIKVFARSGDYVEVCERLTSDFEEDGTLQFTSEEWKLITRVGLLC